MVGQHGARTLRQIKPRRCAAAHNDPTLPQEKTVTYRSLLVLLDADPLCAARTQLAFKLARQLDCHLVGVAPTGLVDLPASMGAAASLAEFAALACDTLRDQAEQ